MIDIPAYLVLINEDSLEHPGLKCLSARFVIDIAWVTGNAVVASKASQMPFG